MAHATFNWQDTFLLEQQLSGEIVMDGVFNPEENAFAEVQGLKRPFTCLTSARPGIAAF